jgi:hypothetical protein
MPCFIAFQKLQLERPICITLVAQFTVMSKPYLQPSLLMSNCHWQLPSLKSIVHTQSIQSRVPEVTYISRGPENLQDELDKI